MPGCGKPVEDRTGRYARLCASHKTELREANARAFGGGSRGKAEDATVASVRALVPAARKLDVARRRVAKLPPATKAKEVFDAAARAAQLNPSAENLAALDAATRELRAGLPRREKLEADLAAAALAFRAALAGLAQKTGALAPPARATEAEAA